MIGTAPSPSRLAAAALLGCLCAGCGHRDRSTAGAAATSAPSASAVPVDHLAPGELPEGPEKVFALVLPRGVHVDDALGRTALATGSVNCDATANYVRVRVTGGSVTTGAGATVFDQVHVKADPTRTIHIRVQRMAFSGVCRIEFRDDTPTDLPQLPDEAARFRAVGLTPNGKLADPKHLE